MHQLIMGDSDNWKSYGVVIIIQVIYTWMFITSKAAFNAGLSPVVFLFYRQAVASLFLVPFSVVAKWGTAPKLSLILLFKFFMLALIGITIGLNVYNIGLKYTSETVASAAFNAIPVITFFLAFLLRMETLKLRRIHGMAKAIGVMLCLAGVVVIALYVGPAIHPFNHNSLFHQSGNSDGQVHSKATWIKGTFLLLFANTAWSLWLVMQGLMLKECPSKLLLTTIQCIFSMFQSFVVALAFERDFSKWKLAFDVRLLAVLYSGIFNAVISWYLQAWCIEKKGPVFVAMSNPLTIIFTIFSALFFLGETIHLGSVLGGILTVAGLYSVLWGKYKESKLILTSNENLNIQGAEHNAILPIHENQEKIEGIVCNDGSVNTK
ncbi:hypothetical protein LUZ60_015053 [Juncus effusus]|nr:hypothetical protein LUZ60_015053 [Juncus effusus]